MISVIFFSLLSISNPTCEFKSEGLTIAGLPFSSPNLGMVEKLESCEIWKEDSDILLLRVQSPKEGTSSLRESTTLFILKKDSSQNWREAFHYVTEQRVYPSNKSSTQAEVLKFPLELKRDKDGKVFVVLAAVDEKIQIK
ncbi:MAG: hypothetical protein COV44_10465 [Deltaproteobacteria bacterium CG11_big_fil_rev_8_21_14_0_20_45_16]|nr:MAG: hypothetical protein COV44_10465 [Deltaproteobacteria bacterium CG11_big_fil_rev_8_21_14_0_20_45_16]